MDTEAHKLAALKEELRKDMEALERVEKLIASKNGSLTRQSPIPITSEKRSAVESEETEAPVTSLRGTIEHAINADPNVRWTTQKVLSHLQTTGYPLRAQKPIYSVGQALQKLAEAKKIRLVRKGVGSAPNIYKGLAESQAGSTEVHSGVEETFAEMIGEWK